MPETHHSIFDTAYLRSVWGSDFEIFRNSDEAAELKQRLENWAAREWQKETTAEGAFIDLFFKKIWGYTAAGESDKEKGYTLWQQFPVKNAGQGGGTGKADIALGLFGRADVEPIPQVLGEFKDDRSGLDKPQIGRKNSRSPVDQCLDYLREARSGLNSAILPTWGVATDMNEFRLYRSGSKVQYQRFIIQPPGGDFETPLVGDGEDAAFQRFLFYRMFHSGWLLTAAGKSKLETLLNDQLLHEQALEKEFYLEYHAFRERVYQTLCLENPQYEKEGRLRRLVKFAQRFLDRCLFILYCEDMGAELRFPPNLLRDLLMEVSTSKFYSPDGEEAWTYVKRLFVSMRNGTPFGNDRISRFNGGLFEENPEMDALKLPNRIFCEQNQGQSAPRVLSFPRTLLYFSAKYNFGVADDGSGRTLTLTTMGRIFEQSITDLEVMEARAEGRESLSEITKRKRDGVYYTPEWVTHYIVEETVGARLAEIRASLNFEKFADVTEERIREYHEDRRKSKIVGEYIQVLHQYGEQLNKLKVVDPACGSGAFLIQAFQYLYDQRQWLALEIERVTRNKQVFDIHTVMREVLSQNLYGVDINPESVEITRLALWLHTALPDRPLTTLDRNIRCGNSLIGGDFYRQLGLNQDLFNDDERERINTFEWAEVFPEIFEGDDPGFDCVIGNPPYVKLQHFRKIQEDVARYLVEAKGENGSPLYESTQTGNFDMYLPFIEKGVALLNSKGKMGYIAPNVWLVNEYGKGLRKKLKRARRLERWVDFKSFQVFDEAITYTALQFFSGAEQDAVRCVFAPGGRDEIFGVDWHKVENLVYFENLSENDSWRLIPIQEMLLIHRLNLTNKNLGEVVEAISQGLISGAFWIFANKKLENKRYLHKPNQRIKKIPPYEIEIENNITLSLASGEHIKRYVSVITELDIIFPYSKDGKAELYDLDTIKDKFPKTFKFLKTYEGFLKKRDGGQLDDDKWYRYSRNQNLDKQPLPKIMIAGTAQTILCTVDEAGEIAANDKRVYSIFTSSIEQLWFIAGILNSPVISFYFQRIARPKAGGFYDIEKQFLAPLPIPNATPSEKQQVAEKAKTLQSLHTRRRDLLIRLDKRLSSPQCENDKRNENWLWADVKTPAQLKKEAPETLKGRELTAWAKTRREELLNAHLEAIDGILRPGAKLTVANEHGELKLLADGVPLIEGVFLNENEAEFIAALWRQKARQTNITPKFTAKKLINLLLKLRKTDNPAIVEQVIRIDREIQAKDEEIEKAEADMNRLTYQLYHLTEEEIRLVEKG